MRRIIFLTAFFLTAVFVAMAGEALHVHTASGGEIVYAFADKPEVTFEGTDMVLTTVSATVRYPISDLKAFSFNATKPEGIEHVTMSDPNGDVTVRIYRLDGTLVKTVEAVAGVSQYSLGDLPAATYVVKSNAGSYKLIKK